MDSVDPFTKHGRWLVGTASGARHLFDSTDPSQPVTIVRIAPEGVVPAAGFELAALRRDGSPVRVASVLHRTADGVSDGVLVGEDMLLSLEPLDPAATVTLRRTTPVTSIECVGDDYPGESR